MQKETRSEECEGEEVNSELIKLLKSFAIALPVAMFMQYLSIIAYGDSKNSITQWLEIASGGCLAYVAYHVHPMVFKSRKGL